VLSDPLTPYSHEEFEQWADGERADLARQIAEKMLREAYRHGLLASDLMTALQEIAPRRGEAARSGPRGQEEV
jgi:hypothetical protein